MKKETQPTKRLCKQPKVKPRVFKPNVSADRRSLILSNDKKWVNGTAIKYFFMEGAPAQKNVVRKAFKMWKDLGIGLSFAEVSNAAEAFVRIGFKQGDGSWSYVGRDVLSIAKNRRTMNFGWDLTTPYGLSTALHEIGHTLGLQHEHQSPFSGIEWDVDAVYAEFSGPPNNWPKAEIDANIISKMAANQLSGSKWDPKSVMEYEFGPGLVKKPVAYRNGIYPPGGLSATDVKTVKSVYPALSTPAAKTVTLDLTKDQLIKAAAGGQANFVFKAPATAKYTFQTMGELDSVMVIYEKGKTENFYLGGDDDSGLDKNAKIELPLVKGREYLINIRIMYAPTTKAGSIMVSSK